jgi:hypothetical protein
MHARRLALIATLALIGGCKSNGGTPEEACSAFASTYCSILARCAPLELRSTYGDVATCTNRFGIECMSVATLPGTAWTPSKLGDCEHGLASVSCGAALSIDTIPACRATPGSLLVGAACAEAVQCASLVCQHTVVSSPDAGSTGALCGTCAASPARPPGSCGSAGDCTPPDICMPSPVGGTQCGRPLPQGAACSAAYACEPGLTCTGSVCSPPRGPGSPCTLLNECDRAQGLVCFNSTCLAPTWVEPGTACHAQQLCSGGRCVGQSIDPGTTGVCTAFVADGAACDPLMGPPCLSPARCRNGTCQIESVNVCM